MPSKLTFTGPLGPGNSVTTLVFNNVHDLNYNTDAQTLEVVYENTAGERLTQQVDLHATTTITMTISAGVITATVSQ